MEKEKAESGCCRENFRDNSCKHIALNRFRMAFLQVLRGPFSFTTTFISFFTKAFTHNSPWTTYWGTWFAQRISCWDTSVDISRSEKREKSFGQILLPQEAQESSFPCSTSESMAVPITVPEKVTIICRTMRQPRTTGKLLELRNSKLPMITLPMGPNRSAGLRPTASESFPPNWFRNRASTPVSLGKIYSRRLRNPALEDIHLDLKVYELSSLQARIRKVLYDPNTAFPPERTRKNTVECGSHVR